ncbi:MAG: response regulator transcription factor, partial [Anaerovibrio sp.]|nr:response regulator transcription factor [Anaerovibrio sp.]
QKAILLLTARDAVEDRVTGLDAGADDYLVKPFEFSELMARLRALSRRSSQKIQQDIVELGGFTLDRTSKLLMKGKQEIQLSPREFQIFDLLVQNMGIVVPREIILDRIWGIESDVSSNNIDSYVKLIRKKLDLADGKIMINTIRGVGYKLEAK